jgi:AcrR family transcriptional regulator
MLLRVAKRLTGEEARARILDAASQRLRAEGPKGLRLDAIARELGISRQAILHHFGTRERLIAAVVDRALERLSAELAGGLSVLSTERDHASFVMMERTFEVIADSGYGRLLGWLALEDQPGSEDFFGERRLLASLAQLSHQLRVREVGPADYRDTLFTFVLGSLVTLASSVFERGVFRAAGLDEDPNATKDFRAWFTALVVDHLEHPKPPA